MIQLRIKDESDLYNPYVPSQTRINDGVYHYLKSFCSEKEYRKHIHDTLQIIADGPIDAEGFHKALQDAVNRDRYEFDRQIARTLLLLLRQLYIANEMRRIKRQMQGGGGRRCRSIGD